MKALAAISVILTLGQAGAASAQSVLERVLGAITDDGMLPVTGIFANIAGNISGPTVPGTMTEGGWTDGDGASITDQQMQDAFNAAQATFVSDYNTAHYIDSYSYEDPFDPWMSFTLYRFWIRPATDEYHGYYTLAEAQAAQGVAAAAALAADALLSDFTTWQAATYSYTEGSETSPRTLVSAIDGSISNAMTGITSATAAVGADVLAHSDVQIDIGDLSTTVLGAVNTGDMTLGVNQDVSEAISGTSSAVSSSIAQLGGVTDQTALVLNVASNATDVIGSVNNSFASLNGSIGNVATTVLGAVNTGTIISGINAAVTGTQSGITGMN
ncbi:hypothetical protein D2N39_20645 [Gemmobacter lutimaris]|uniref:Uncharacterized protein n=1 Tax=Gemmobacter lutimaris TaxID=2306023 RepID=A0A398BHE3_9RHOB|nr:hypothetical protein [Gemmobacter lutimaris]RID89885.1 hypothetical protein D2N39_20645 [Gemmobacter lutimaris]